MCLFEPRKGASRIRAVIALPIPLISKNSVHIIGRKIPLLSIERIEQIVFVQSVRIVDEAIENHVINCRIKVNVRAAGRGVVCPSAAHDRLYHSVQRFSDPRLMLLILAVFNRKILLREIAAGIDRRKRLEAGRDAVRLRADNRFILAMSHLCHPCIFWDSERVQPPVDVIDGDSDR